MIKFAQHWAPRVLPPILLALAAWVLWRELHQLSLSEVTSEVADWGPQRLGTAAGLTVLSFLLLALMEWLGLRWAGAKVPFSATLAGSFCANAFAHTVGFALLVGGAVRARLYRPHGATLLMVAQTSVFCSISFGFGIAALAGGALILHPGLSIDGLNIPAQASRLVGALLLASPVTYIGACALIRGPITIAGRDLTLPSAAMATGQVAVGLADNIVTAMVVWVLLPGQATPYPEFASAYSLATIAGLLSSVPGGAGVFEGAMLAILTEVSRTSLAAAFVGYRLVYYVVPLVLAAVLLVRSGLWTDVRPERIAPILRKLAAPVLTAASFALGASLILTGVGRIDPDRLAILRANVPLIIVETSHLLSLVSGIVLMAASLGLLRRRRRAVDVAVAAAVIGASTALLRGLDIGPSVLAATLGVALVLCRNAFDRRVYRRSDRLTGWWLIGMLAVVLGAAALGLWVYGDTPYETRLWAQMAYHGDPARFLRGIASMGAALLALGAWGLARAAGPSAAPATDSEAEAIRPLVEASPDTTARLALTRDKALLVSEAGDAFIMYGVEGRSMIAMGDPIGDREAGRALLWRFRELADVADARTVVYHASPHWLTEYLDLGLSLLKLGEEARVLLPEFDLAGGRRRGVRQGHAKAAREGLTFEVVQPPIATGLLAELEAISDAWLLAHGGREKGFSLGRFDPVVLVHDPIALVRFEGRIVAFANIWTGGQSEASLDLMRHPDDAPRGVMDFLFVELILWAKAQGFEWFNLGMAPLTGLADHPLAPIWHKIGAQVARRGGRFYGFEGLRAFKAKFDPVWTPRYLAAPPTSMAAAIVDAARLVGRPPPVRLGPAVAAQQRLSSSRQTSLSSVPEAIGHAQEGR